MFIYDDIINKLIDFLNDIPDFSPIDLVSGDVVIYRNGDIKYVLFDTKFGDIITSRDRKTYANLDEYNIDFTYNGDHQYDIVKVYRPKNKFRYLSADIQNDYDIIWEAKTKKQVTMAELRDILGGDFEIVG